MDVCPSADFPRGTGNPTVLLLSILTPILVMLCAFSLFINSRILSLICPSPSGQEKFDWRPWDEKSREEDQMSYSPDARAPDLLDGRLDDIQFQPLRPLAMTPVQDENTPPLIDGPEDLLGGFAEKLKIAALDPKRAPRALLHTRYLRDETVTNTSSNTNTVLETANEPKLRRWDGKINWALKGSSVFDDADEELGAFYTRPNMLGRQPYSELWVFQYGLRYIPSVSDSEVYRTVRIENLPGIVKLGHILPLVCGEIYSARIANTSSITGYNTAMITFVTQEDALSFVSETRAKEFAGPSVKVIPVHTPTYPMPADMERLISDKGYTRTISMSHSRPSLHNEIIHALNSPYHKHTMQLESIIGGPGKGEVSIKMFSVKAAATVFEWLSKHPTLGKSRFRFLRQDGTHFEKQRLSLDAHVRDSNW